MFLQKKLQEIKDGEIDEEIKRFQATLFSPVGTINTQSLDTKVFEKELELFIQLGERSVNIEKLQKHWNLFQ